MYKSKIISASSRSKVIKRATFPPFSSTENVEKSLEEKLDDFFKENEFQIEEIASISYTRAPEAPESEIALIVYKVKAVSEPADYGDVLPY